MVSAPTKPWSKDQSWAAVQRWQGHGLIKQHSSEITEGGGRGRGRGQHGNLSSILGWEPHGMHNESDDRGMYPKIIREATEQRRDSLWRIISPAAAAGYVIILT